MENIEINTEELLGKTPNQAKRYVNNKLKEHQTRLLGRPQPQMYLPVALNQYTLVNRTHKHYIYMLQGPTNILKSHQSSTICKIWK